MLDLNEGKLKLKVEEIARHHIHGYYRYLDILSTISVATPLFGLLGTVLGMIDVFEQVIWLVWKTHHFWRVVYLKP